MKLLEQPGCMQTCRRGFPLLGVAVVTGIGVCCVCCEDRSAIGGSASCSILVPGSFVTTLSYADEPVCGKFSRTVPAAS